MRTATVRLIAPQTQFEDRRNQLDLRLTRMFVSSSKTRPRANVDLYNVFNGSGIVSINNAHGPEWRQALATSRGSGFMEGRLLQFNAQPNF